MSNNNGNNNNSNNNGNKQGNNFERRSINENCTVTQPATRPRPKPPGNSSRENK